MRLLSWIQSVVILVTVILGLASHPQGPEPTGDNPAAPTLEIVLHLEDEGEEQCWTGFVTLADTADARPGESADGRPADEDLWRAESPDAGNTVECWIARFESIVEIVKKVFDLLARDWAWLDRLL